MSQYINYLDTFRVDSCPDGSIDTIQVPAGNSNFTYHWCFSFDLNDSICDSLYSFQSTDSIADPWIYDSCGIYNISLEVIDENGLFNQL